MVLLLALGCSSFSVRNRTPLLCGYCQDAHLSGDPFARMNRRPRRKPLHSRKDHSATDRRPRQNHAMAQPTPVNKDTATPQKNIASS